MIDLDNYNENIFSDKDDERNEELLEEDLNLDLNKFNQAVIWSTDWTTETIFNQLKKGNIDLNPSFQRRDAWNDKNKSKLIESLMLGLPVPPIILAENKRKRNSYIVIDGKQRLLSIRRFYVPKVCQTDIDPEGFKVLKLTGLEILKKFNGCKYDCESENFQEFINSLDNQPIRTIVIRNWPDESFLYTVFLRLNTTSKTLSPQELRQSLKPGPFLNYLDLATSESKVIQRMLHNSGPDKRMKDVELTLRFFAFRYFIKEYTGNLKLFLDITCDKMNKDWNINEGRYKEDFHQMEQAILFSFSIVDANNPFSRLEKGRAVRRFNRSIFELFTYYFSDKSVQKLVGDNKESFKEKLYELNNNPEFIAATSDTTKKISNVVKRFCLFADLLKSLSTDNDIKIKFFKENAEGKIDVI